jgi:hypothetical protein
MVVLQETREVKKWTMDIMWMCRHVVTRLHFLAIS